ncbi:MAG: FAD-binding protein [bacterium]|nr:FAD-binding protein [bacterium]MYA43164.1 FAD-binding protein [Gemmatimonadota bacterium]MYE93806.1 FAD-binding protein [Gemmatimonadota bacterium]MYJ11676.1 FAD-binding protein [Gemmatimonadota bacterium]
MFDSTRAVAHLKQSMQGRVTNAPDVVGDASFDFGRLVTRTPSLVAFPRDPQDIANLFTYANRHRIQITTQGASHTQGGHTLSASGIVLRTDGLDAIVEINAEANWALVESGVRWADLIETTLRMGYLPPLVTTNLHTTVGGTHSVGGVGLASFRYGSQADICLGLEVVRPTGEVVWCSSHTNKELFDHVLCGLGQFGVMTKLKIPIRRFKPRTVVFNAFCHSLEQFTDAIRRIVANGCPGIRGLAGMIVESSSESTRYVLRCTAESTPCEGSQDRSITELLHDTTLHMAEADTRHIVLSGLGKRIEKPQWDKSSVDPGFHCILPSTNADCSIAGILSALSSSSTGLNMVEYYLLPVHRRDLTKPLLKAPQDNVVFVFGCSPSFDRSQESKYRGAMRRFADCVQSGNGKHYLIGCTAFRKPDWERHYAESWSAVNRLKQRYDPNRILNQNLIPYEWRD